MECTDVTIAGRSLSFAVPAVKGSWSGALEEDDLTLAGTWTQGREIALKLVRDTFIAAVTPSPIDGIWLGHLSVDEHAYRIQLIVKSDQAGRQVASLDSIDQRATGLACTQVSFCGDRFSFEVPSVNGRWAGTLSADLNRLTGRWTQLVDRPLDFERQTQIARVTPLPPPRMLPALPPVAVADLGSQLSRDLEAISTDGWLSKGNSGGVVIGVVQGGERAIASFGAASAASIFEVGSLSKTFT
ncbi:hypothetical protein QYH69_20015 [Paraburkholderia sp. SARCC-3016]|uniref:hypothetical protein n=1 Tax=Paraburkholderia sp. SARCC-3016 TaxID=3058611 RepID=UPI002809ADDB|nr:hypothetical protein [Paraburkholderia sp. SARCC-3016]MDQ7979539.1 hypothetical protein [Paraburkholderia sp. SARCC-3016]